MEPATVIRSRLFIYLFLLLGPILGCNPPQIVNSPCANLNVTLQIKPSANLSFMFGNDAIQAAMDSISREIVQNANASSSVLTTTGTDVAFRTAKAHGKSPVANDITELETLLRKDVIPTIMQSPTCVFKVSASTKRDVSIEDVYLENIGDKQIAKVKIANTGQEGARFIHVVVRNIIDGMTPLSGQTEMVLSPGQWRNVSNPQATFPMSDIGSGKKKLIVIVQLSYAKEAGSQPFVYQEEWKYDPLSQTFKQSPIK